MQMRFCLSLKRVNRTQNNDDFMLNNYGSTDFILNELQKNNNKAPVLMSSSTQAALDNPYGISKKAGENVVFEYGKKNNVKTFVYRLTNVFGKWCRPNYNSAVATFCHNIANDLPIQINDRNYQMELVYIDDVVDEFIAALNGNEHKSKIFALCRRHIKFCWEKLRIYYMDLKIQERIFLHPIS